MIAEQTETFVELDGVPEDEDTVVGDCIECGRQLRLGDPHENMGPRPDDPLGDVQVRCHPECSVEPEDDVAPAAGEDVRVRVAKIVREAMEDAGQSERLNTFVQNSMWDYTDRILALLRAPRGEGEGDALGMLQASVDEYLWEAQNNPQFDAEAAFAALSREIRAALRSEAPGEDCPETDVIVDIHPANWQDGRVVSDAAVRITHVPTGITVICDDQPTLARNKAVAIAGLRAAVRAARRGEGGGE